MAKSKFEYVKQFEDHDKCLPNCWIVVRVDGKGFQKFSEKHNFHKPNDSRSLHLMTNSARAVMREFIDIVLAYGQSDEYSFVFRKDTDIYKRRSFKILSSVCSTFTSNFVYNWPEYFISERLLYPPSFDGRVILYPSDKNMMDYLAWRQADVHINNLYNTCFWNLIQKGKMNNQQAQARLMGTVSAEKHELLFKEFGINYNREPEEFRRGTTLIRKSKKKTEIIEYTGDIIGQAFWDDHSYLLTAEKMKSSKDRDKHKDKEKVQEVDKDKIPDVDNENIPEVDKNKTPEMDKDNIPVVDNKVKPNDVDKDKTSEVDSKDKTGDMYKEKTNGIDKDKVKDKVSDTAS